MQGKIFDKWNLSLILFRALKPIIIPTYVIILYSLYVKFCITLVVQFFSNTNLDLNFPNFIGCNKTSRTFEMSLTSAITIPPPICNIHLFTFVSTSVPIFIMFTYYNHIIPFFQPTVMLKQYEISARVCKTELHNKPFSKIHNPK